MIVSHGYCAIKCTVGRVKQFSKHTEPTLSLHKVISSSVAVLSFYCITFVMVPHCVSCQRNCVSKVDSYAKSFWRRGVSRTNAPASIACGFLPWHHYVWGWKRRYDKGILVLNFICLNNGGVVWRNAFLKVYLGYFHRDVIRLTVAVFKSIFPNINIRIVKYQVYKEA